MARVLLREVDPKQAIAHAIWEARTCVDAWAFCAALAMLRKAIDLWSVEYQERHGLSFDSKAGEKDNIFWRLQKIAGENKLYADAIHQVIDELRLDANDAVHNSKVCIGENRGYQGHQTLETPLSPDSIKAPYSRLVTLVSGLISMTMR